MFGSRRRLKVAAPLFMLGLGLMFLGVGWELWISAVGVVVFAIGVALLWRRRREFSPY